MARHNSGGGSDYGGAGQRVNQALMLPAAEKTDPLTIHIVYERQSLDTNSYVSWVDRAYTADIDNGWFNLSEQSSGTYVSNYANRLWLDIYRDKGSATTSSSDRIRTEWRYNATSGYTAGPQLDTVYAATWRVGVGTTAWDIADGSLSIQYDFSTLGSAPESVPQNGSLNVGGNIVAGENPSIHEQVMLAARTGNKAFKGKIYCISIHNRALSDAEVHALHLGYDPQHFPYRLKHYNSCIRNFASPEIHRSGLTITDSNGSVGEHDAPILYLPTPVRTAGVSSFPQTLTVGHVSQTSVHAAPALTGAASFNASHVSQTSVHAAPALTGAASFNASHVSQTATYGSLLYDPYSQIVPLAFVNQTAVVHGAGLFRITDSEAVDLSLGIDGVDLTLEV